MADWTLATALAGVVLGLGSFIVTALALKNEHRKAAAWEEMAKSQVRIAESLEREVRSLQQEVANLKTGRPSQPDYLKVQALEERKRRAEWARTKDLAKGLRWLLENSD